MFAFLLEIHCARLVNWTGHVRYVPACDIFSLDWDASSTDQNTNKSLARSRRWTWRLRGNERIRRSCCVVCGALPGSGWVVTGVECVLRNAASLHYRQVRHIDGHLHTDWHNPVQQVQGIAVTAKNQIPTHRRRPRNVLYRPVQVASYMIASCHTPKLGSTILYGSVQVVYDCKIFRQSCFFWFSFLFSMLLLRNARSWLCCSPFGCQ